MVIWLKDQIAGGEQYFWVERDENTHFVEPRQIYVEVRYRFHY
jgi:hypothetical protein